ncbi:MAG: CpaF family protein [Miltoncostaeaceae bacterium]
MADPRLVEEIRAAIVRGGLVEPGRATRQAVAALAEDALDDGRHILPSDARGAVVMAVVDAMLGLGPLEPLLRDPEVTEVMVNGPARVWVERSGRIEPVGTRFADADHLLHVIDRILAPLGRRLDEASPMVDARLPDGSRVNAVVPPLSIDGPVLTVRRFPGERLKGDDLVRLGALSEEMLIALHSAVAARRNILVTGGTGSGKTTTLAALCAAIDPSERVITIEDAAELRLPLEHVVRLESRPPGVEGRGAVPIRALMRNALRMRPDRIIVGEVRGGEALDMISALTTGHEGSLSTLHASSPREALRRLVTLALMGDLELPWRAVADQVASAVDLVVHQARDASGARRTVELAEVLRGHEGPEVRRICRWRPEGAGGFVWTPSAARWRDELQRDARRTGVA